MSSDNIHNFFNSAMPSLRSPMKMIGDLKRQNCTTLFSDINTTHSDKYYFRVENEQFRSTDMCDFLQINVQDSAWKPSVHLSGVKKEHQTVSINCSALTPCPHSPPKLTWNLQQEPPQNLVQTPDGTFSTSIQHSLTLSDKHHGLEVICAAVYPGTGGHRRAQATLPLSVDYSPKDTSLWLKANPSLSVGEKVNMSCSSRAWPPVHSFSWFRVSSQGPQRVYGGQIYSFIFNSTTQGEYFCQAKNQVGQQNSPTIKLQTEDANTGIGPYTVLKICGVAVLFTALLLILCVNERLSDQILSPHDIFVGPVRDPEPAEAVPGGQASCESSLHVVDEILTR
ncbi:hypothetical protein WMY93_009227 [Mugilogobius chulae]|uniref:Ig-like domain-containing protein n=1 Tax=Mugilogobius chulae TaxID=88201 RepID=A0AAW0PLK9_9GOBI